MRRRPLLLVLLVLAAAGFWRLHGLGHWSLDGDEVYSHYDVLALLAGQPREGVLGYPLGYVLMSGSAALLGADELGLRAASALCGLLAVAALLLLRRDALDNAVALTAGALAALSPWLIYHSQEARFYAPLLLFATLATLLALPGPGQRPRLAVGCALLAAACHPSALLLLPLFTGVALRRWLSWRAVAVLGLLAAAGGGAWLLLGDSTLPRLVQHAIGLRVLARYDALHFAGGLGYAIGPAALLLILLGALAAVRTPRAGDRLLLALAALPPLLLLPLSAAGASVQQRYVMAAVPAALLLAGRGVQSLAGAPALRGALLGLALLAPAPQLWAYAQDGDRSDWRGAAAWVAAQAQADDIVVADEHAMLDYYLEHEPGWEATGSDEVPLPEKQLWSFVRDRHDVWVVVKSNRMDGAYGAEFDAWLAEHFAEVARIGPPPPPLTVHDNQLVILRRHTRVVDGR